MRDFAVHLLKRLIAIPSVSRHENKTADLLQEVFSKEQIRTNRLANNVWVTASNYDASRPTLLLNSHHDTVPANKHYSFHPSEPFTEDGKLYGLGSNDAGGALVSLLTCFLHFYHRELPFNLIFAASAEEEISGQNGIEALLRQLPAVDMAIVGEPTGMNMAVAEKGLLVLDCTAMGRAGHAARDEGENAIYKAMRDIDVIRQLAFEKVSDFLGPVHLAVTSIHTKNKAHNVVPDQCAFVVDIRVNERYTFDEILQTLEGLLESRVAPRSLRLKPSFIEMDHPLVQAGLRCGMSTYGSPTLSDMALMHFPAVKLGPGDSARSHTADEFIFVEELETGIDKYNQLLNHLSEIFKS